jgi:tetratricopeptide (TPR) repeat protein
MAIMARKNYTKNGRGQIYFISPGDLRQERRRIPSIVGGINRERGLKRDSPIQVIQWHDNSAKSKSVKPDWKAYFDDSDLVIMLLWKHWGESSGGYSSEFRRAYAAAKRRAGAVWLYFHEISDKILLDPDRQSARVIAFRDIIERSDRSKFFWYENVDQWKQIIDDHLNLWIEGKSPKRLKVHGLPEHGQRLAGWIRAMEKAGDKRDRSAFRMAQKAFDYAREGRLTKACQMFARAIARSSEPYIINEYGLFLKENHLLGKAENQYNRMAEIGRSGRDTLLIGSATRHLGDIHEKQNNLEAADEYYHESLTAEADWDRKIKKAQLYKARGMVQYKIGNPESAEKWFLKALEQYRAANLVEGMALAYYCLVGVYIELGDKNRAADACSRALSLAIDMGEKKLVRLIKELCAKIEII